LVDFFTRPTSPMPLAVFRIGVAGVLLAQDFVLSDFVSALYGQYGYIQWLVGSAIASPNMPTIEGFYELVGIYGIEPRGATFILFFLHIILCIFLLLGVCTRMAAFLLWIVDMCFMNSGILLTYGLGSFLHIALFYCAAMPVGSAISVDNLFTKRRVTPSVWATASIRVLQIHLCIVYFTAGLSKLSGLQWWQGEAIWRSVVQPRFMQFDLLWLANYPTVPLLLGLLTFSFQTSYPVFVWWRRTRQLCVVGAIVFHLAIALVLGLWLFSAIMIVFDVAAFGALERYHSIGARALAWNYFPRRSHHRNVALLSRND
jgi:uncharacterized membrane protein YphA (DoxX/SURF4 family)